MDDLDYVECPHEWPRGNMLVNLDCREEWRQWLLRTFRRLESGWVASGDLLYKAGDSWLRHLGFDPKLKTRQLEAFEDSQSEGHYDWRDAYSAGAPGLYWRMVPIYDRRQKSDLWLAMQRELYLTSVFNIGATREQNEEVWGSLERRFVLAYRRMSWYEYVVRRREQKVLDWSREGKTGPEMAKLLLKEGLYPLDLSPYPGPLDISEDRWDDLVPTALRVVRRIRAQLVRQGHLAVGKPGRPRKSEEA